MNAPFTQSDVIARNLADPIYFCERFLEEWFPTPMPWLHRGLMAIMTRRCKFLEQDRDIEKIIRNFVWSLDPFDKTPTEYPIFNFVDGKLTMTIRPFTALMLPRGFSKTTLYNAKTIYKICHMLTRFTLFTAESGPHAEMQVTNVKTQFEINEMILKFYGSLKGKTWANDDFETSTGIKVVARGRGAMVRGLLHNGKRPDDIGADDIEDEESVSTELQRKKVRSWVYRALIPVLNKWAPDKSITFMGTLLHNEALLMQLPRDPRFNFVRFGAVDKDGEAIWPEHMSLDDLQTIKEANAAGGELAAFYLEYMSQISNEETAKFKNNFIYEVPDPKKLLCLAIAVDPAISEKKTSDYFAIASAGMADRGRLYAIDEFGKKGVAPREQVDRVFEAYANLKAKFPGVPIKVGVEAIAYQAALVHLLREEMFRKHVYFEIEALKYNTKKTDRVEGILQPRYANGYIVHAKRLPLLESQLVDWPNGKLDMPDALANAISLLDPYAAAAADGRDLEADEYEEENFEEPRDHRGRVIRFAEGDAP